MFSVVLAFGISLEVPSVKLGVPAGDAQAAVAMLKKSDKARRSVGL